MEVEKLCEAIMEWCIQIELAADIIEKAELYGYFNCNKNEKELHHELTK
jgi:hypothetical protein